MGIISRNIMSKFSWSHPFCRFCLFSSTFMSGDQLPRVGQGRCGFEAAAVSRHCAPMRSFFLRRWKTFWGTLRSILGFCAQSHWWKCALDCLEAQCIASRMEGLGVDNDNSPRDWNTVAENKFQFQLLKLDLLEWLVLLEVDEAVELLLASRNCCSALQSRHSSLVHRRRHLHCTELNTAVLQHSSI